MALTAYYTRKRTTGLSEYHIIKFDLVTLNIGIKDIEAFKNTGKFICESAGIYLISASYTVATPDADYYIQHNDQLVSQGVIGSSGLWLTGSAAVTLNLLVNDSVWFRLDDGKGVWGGRSCYISIYRHIYKKKCDENKKT